MVSKGKGRSGRGRLVPRRAGLTKSELVLFHQLLLPRVGIDESGVELLPLDVKELEIPFHVSRGLPGNGSDAFQGPDLLGPRGGESPYLLGAPLLRFLLVVQLVLNLLALGLVLHALPAACGAPRRQREARGKARSGRTDSPLSAWRWMSAMFLLWNLLAGQRSTRFSSSVERKASVFKSLRRASQCSKPV